MPQIPNPKYDYDTEKIVKAYKTAIKDILATLDRIDISNMTRANTAAALTEVAMILASINEESAQWVAENIPIATRDGVLSALVSLDVKDAVKVASFNKLNRGMVDAIIADTQSDLLAVTQNVERRVRSAVRTVTAESMRANMARGVNGRKTISRDILDGLRKKLGDSVNTGIIDAAGRRWKPEVYVDMITRTKTLAAHKEATINEAVGRKAYYGVISRHGAKDDCRKWEGRVVKLVPDASGDYPYIGDIPRNEIFHPCCRHVVTPIRDPKSVEDKKYEAQPTEETLEHAVIGNFTRNPRTGALQNMKGGGHGQGNIDFLEEQGLDYNIVKTYSNGVRIGNVPKHKEKLKKTGTGQSWFPKDWDSGRIKEAGEFVANLPNPRRGQYGALYGTYMNVDVGVYVEGKVVTTIFPDGRQSHLKGED
ncbi:phage minor capsid protein [Paenibacillus terrigena]|uniref:phage minor capsid protein n=1 Tax=Paenibacillus terrigena TaxID=369333 RepID=UPI0028D7A97E|nr:phage minor capsid protein [Paenibacillus terrigena]